MLYSASEKDQLVPRGHEATNKIKISKKDESTYKYIDKDPGVATVI